MDWDTLLLAALNGVFLVLGVYLGERYTMNGLERRLNKMFGKSKTWQKLIKILNSPSLEQDLNKLLKNAAGFFEEARTLVSSPEAKNFFKNASELIEQFSSESPEIVKIPKKPQA